MTVKRPSLKDLRTSLLGRGLRLAKAGLGGWSGQMEVVVEELGKLKGTAMKVGQSLSLYGEHLLPREVNELLKTLQQDAPPLEWPVMREVLVSELGVERVSDLEIEETPVASASIGQVHRAVVRLSGEILALKIQYPRVEDAVETDLRLLKFILNVSNMIPRGPRFDQIFDEIRVMFQQEIDYEFEFSAGSRFRLLLASDPRFLVPEFHPRFSSRRVLAMTFLDGLRADSGEVQALSLERRNRLGLAFLELYLRELLQFKLMQTDPHAGNYKILIDESGAEQDRLVLFDFGASREVPDDFLNGYRLLIEGGITRNERLVEKGGRVLGLLLPEDGQELVEDYIALCFLLCEPFQSVYDWGASDLPKRVATQVAKIASSYRLRAPPRELVFLDRKLSGVFVFLSMLKCKMDTREVVLSAL